MNARNVAISSVVLMLAGCGGGGGGGGGGGSSAAGVRTAVSPVSSGLNLATRDPAGYSWQLNFYSPNGVAGGTVTRLGTAPMSTATIVATAPSGRLESVNNGVTTAEATLLFDINSIAAISTALYATTSNEAAPGAGDVYMRDQTGRWTIAYDTTGSDAVVVAHGTSAVSTDVYVFSGGVNQPCAVALAQNSSNHFVPDIAIVGSYIPTQAISYRGEVWVAVADNGAGGGAAKVFRGTGALWREILSLGGSGRARVTGMAVVNTYSLIIAVANFDVGSGRPTGGAVYHFDGERLIGLYGGDAPLGLAVQDNTIYIGTAGGRLLHYANGQWNNEANLPTGIRQVGALLTASQAELMVGVRTDNGAAVFRRIALSGGIAVPVTPAPTPTPTPTPPPAGPAPGSYLGGVKQILLGPGAVLSACASCHRQGGTAGGTNLVFTGIDSQDYNLLTRTTPVQFTNPANPAGSLLLIKGSGGQGHGGGAQLPNPSPAYTTILNWIQNGRPLQ